jgi:hypothetical protein
VEDGPLCTSDREAFPYEVRATWAMSARRMTPRGRSVSAVIAPPATFRHNLCHAAVTKSGVAVTRISVPAKGRAKC